MSQTRDGGDVVAHTERLVLRPWRADEADRLFDMMRRDTVVRWLGVPQVERPYISPAPARRCQRVNVG